MMTKKKVISLALCSALLLTISLAPKRILADGNDEEGRPLHLYATAYPGPIGTVAAAALADRGFTINGRPACGGQPVWSGDLLQSSRDSRVSVALDSIGKVTLSKGSSVRLSTSHAAVDDEAGHFVLVASLERGEIGVSLDRKASAYLRISGSSYSSSEGASFLASRASITVRSGRVTPEQQAGQHDYSIRPVGHGSNITVRAGDLRTIQVQVIEDDRPVPGVAVAFVLDTSAEVVGLLGMGTLSGTSASVVTGDDGIASVQFVARNSSGSSPISATIEGTRVSWTGTITVRAGGGVSKNRGWTIAALLGAGAAAGIAYALSREDKGTLQAKPPEIKNP